MRPQTKMLFVFLSLLLAANLACAGLAAAPTATPTAAPTTIPTKAPPPTQKPAPPAVPTKSTFELDKKIHNHPSGAFSYHPPVGWDIQETNYDAYITDPISGVFFYVSVTNTGIPLDAASYKNLVNYTDNFYYSTFDDYKQTDYYVSDTKDVYALQKTYTFEGKTQFVQSVYNQFGQVTYIFELLGTESVIKSNPDFQAGFDEFISSLEVILEPAATLPIYEPSWNFVGPENSMSISVPIGWEYVYDDHQTYTDSVIESLTSPDGTAVIENISVVDGNAYTMGNAGQVALFLLNDRYSSGGGDVRVLDIKTLNDGSEFWTWKSSKGGYSGTTNFELRNGGKQILLLSFLANDATLDLYNPLFLRVIGTYAIP